METATLTSELDQHATFRLRNEIGRDFQGAHLILIAPVASHEFSGPVNLNAQIRGL